MGGGNVEAPGATRPAKSESPVSDYFSLLGEPRRPWLDAEALKQKFHALSVGTHPDRFHAAPGSGRLDAERRYAELNAAWQCLREPKERLRHLIELETGARPAEIQQVPSELTVQFFDVGRLFREAGAFLDERSRSVSPLIRAQFYERGAEWTERLQALQQVITTRRDNLLAELKAMNSSWESAQSQPDRKSSLLNRLEEIYRLLGYYGRWSDQLQEKIVQLAL